LAATYEGEPRQKIEAAARALRVEIMEFPVRRREDLAPTFAAMAQARVGAILVRNDILVLEPNRAEIVALARKHKLPSIHHWRYFVEAGSLMSYGANLFELHRRSATYVDKILKGAKPADLPVEQPTKFELVINLKTAKALGLTIPQSLLLRADQVIHQ
ncbi:MAG: ABC transporter substrate-binding protein, partial [Dehalococcoidia bacterium]|nr:ABC transporter substrate-binding protein [Dehalococcoidia bacterium]